MVFRVVLTSILLLLFIKSREVSGKKVHLAFLYDINDGRLKYSGREAPAIKAAIDVIREHNVYLKDHDLEIYNYFRHVS